MTQEISELLKKVLALPAAAILIAWRRA